LAFEILSHLFALAKSLTSERPAEPEEPPRSGGDEREFACYTLARAFELTSISILRILELSAVRARLFSNEKLFVSVAPAPFPDGARDGEGGESFEF